MPNKTLNPDQLAQIRLLLNFVRDELKTLSGGDPDLLFAFRRKLYKELTYDERSKPMVRRRLKKLKRAEQNGICPICGKPLPEKYVGLDRLDAVKGYTPENTRLIHPDCDIDVQASRGYA